MLAMLAGVLAAAPMPRRLKLPLTASDSWAGVSIPGIQMNHPIHFPATFGGGPRMWGGGHTLC